MTSHRFTKVLLPQGLIAAAAAVVASQPAQAHNLATGGLAAGFLHPLAGGDHLLLLLAVGGASASISPQLLLWALGGGLAGGLFGAMGGGLPYAELLAALAIAVVALLVVRQHRCAQTPALGWSGSLIAAAVAVHAMLHAQEAHSAAAAGLWWLGALGASLLIGGGSFLLWRRLPSHWAGLLALVLALFGGLLALGPIAPLTR
ncbi:MAG: HupE/UreJ family protein [Synechococcaceae cyanobacterium]